jgi:hypothetical protein
LGFRGVSNNCLGYPSRAFPITNNTSRYRRKLFIYKGLKLVSAGASDRSSRVNARAKGSMKGESRIQQLDAPLHTKLSASPSISSLVNYSTLCI